MNAILDKLLLFACCLALYLFHANIIFAIIPIILTVLLSCIMVYYDNIKFSMAANLLFIFVCIFIPDYVIFLPILLYVIILTKYQYTALALPFLLIIDNELFTANIITFSILLLLTAILLKYKTDRLKNLYDEYNELRDSSSEMSRLLTEKNQNILKNQDDRIHLATLNERNRISKEIHDNIGHLLSRALLQIGAMLIVTKEEIIKEGLNVLKEALSGGMDDIRDSIHHMYDESIDLYSQINELVNDFTFCPLHYEYDITTPPPLALKYSMIAIVKEALANIMKHSNATSVSLVLREHPAMFQLIIKDNGILDNKTKNELLKKPDFEEGMGLRNISDRVKGFSGNLNVILDHGFTLFITIPKTLVKGG